MAFKRKIKLKLTSKMLTVLLSCILFLLIGTTWALYISGPVRVYEQTQSTKMSLIKKQAPDIKGITRHVFDYVTYQGYTMDTLYWFNDNCEIVTTREMSELDYDRAKDIAKEKYGIDCESIVLGYGYNNPVYEIRGKERLILIDFDTFVRVYERGL